MSEELNKQGWARDRPGPLGFVYHGFSRRTGGSFAVKSIDKSLLVDSYDRECVEHEAKLHRIVSAMNPHVVSLHDSFDDELSIHLVLDLCSGANLLHRISSDAPLSELRWQLYRTNFWKQSRHVIAEGWHTGKLKLANFSSAVWFGGLEGEEKMEGIVGMPYYVAPEVIAGRRYNEKVDVWSAGVVIYMMLSGTAPFDGESAGKIFEAVLHANIRFPTRIFGSVSAMAKDSLRRMLSRDVTRRFSAEEALKYPWIMGCGGSKSMV